MGLSLGCAYLKVLKIITEDQWHAQGFARGVVQSAQENETKIEGGESFRELYNRPQKGCRKMDTRARGWVHPILQAFAVEYDIKVRVVFLF